MKTEIRKILCPVDFSDPGRYAFDYACAFAQQHNAILEILHVAEASAYAEDDMPPGEVSYEQSLRLQLEEWAKQAECPAKTHLITGIPYVEIVTYADKMEADLIVIGTHGRTGMKHLLIGSVAERVVRTAACPVLTVRHPDFASREK